MSNARKSFTKFVFRGVFYFGVIAFLNLLNRKESDVKKIKNCSSVVQDAKAIVYTVYIPRGGLKINYTLFRSMKTVVPRRPVHRFFLWSLDQVLKIVFTVKLCSIKQW